MCSPAVKLRSEAFGGLAFHRERGTTVELDCEAFALLQALQRPGDAATWAGSGTRAGAVLAELATLGFLVRADEPAGFSDVRSASHPWLHHSTTPPVGTLSAPETVHLAVTAHCNHSCPGCYARRPLTGSEMSTGELLQLIDQWAEMGVFQLAVGGGEPLLREDLVSVLAHARQRGLVPNVTTNGALLTARLVNELESAGVAQLNVSLNGPTWETNLYGDWGQQAWRALERVADSSLSAGANLLVTPSTLPHLASALERIRALGAVRAVVLAAKPGGDQTWYRRNRLAAAHMAELRQMLKRAPGMWLQVDCALVAALAEVPPLMLQRRGIHGCAAGCRICTVWPDGQVTPCSFLPDLRAGNARETAFDTIWRQGRGWAELRFARTPRTCYNVACIGA